MTERDRQVFRATYKATLLALIAAAETTGIPGRVLAVQFLENPKILDEVMSKIGPIEKEATDGGERT